MGVRREATVEEVLNNHRRRRRHRGASLQDIEKELVKLAEKQSNSELDKDLWRWSSGFKQKFSTMETWQLIRETGLQCDWGSRVWFSKATPKFAFITWLAFKDRLSTLDRVSRWSQGIDTTCVLCKNAPETRSHIFFECAVSSHIWEQLTKGIMRNSYSNSCETVMRLISASMEKKKRFCINYALQVAMYFLWRERNKRRHGEPPMPLSVMLKLIDKTIRNKLSLVQGKRVKGLEEVLQFWFSTRL